MSMTTLLGLSFGVFPCLLFGFIMLLSLLVCEYIEEYVAKHLCAWKNRRRRGLRSFYQDFRARRSAHNGPVQHYSRSRGSPGWVGNGPGEMMFMPEGTPPFPASAPPSERPVHYGAQMSSYAPAMILPANDPPPAYEECVLPRGRRNSSSRVNSSEGPKSKKSSMKKSASTDKDKNLNC